MIYKKIIDYIQTLDTSTISVERKVALQALVSFIQTKLEAKELVQLNFICTHNSRRSHLTQIWAQTLAAYFEIPMVQCYSAGTEATALFPVVMETLKNVGFKIEKSDEETNPIYKISYAENQEAIVGFSKTLDNEFNPTSDFAAILTCNDADKNCPFVPGATVRIPLPFEDPKKFDSTPQQVEKYAERSTQIASELFYVYSQVKKS